MALYEADYQERFEKKLTAYLGEEVDRDRLLTELAILLERGDIHEELDRLSIHLTTMTELLAAETPIGRELDFLIQEMNREVNTIGSKSSPIQIKNSVVQMKTIIEKSENKFKTSSRRNEPMKYYDITFHELSGKMSLSAVFLLTKRISLRGKMLA